MLGDSRAHDLPAIVRQNDHHVEQPKRRRCHYEHVDRGDAYRFVAQEAPPARRRPAVPPHHVLSDSSLTDLDAELEQLAMDARRTPQRVGVAHLPDQIANLAIDCGPS
jgi:hypothetical protein